MKLCLRCNQYFEDGIELCPIDTSQLEAVGDHPLIGALINDRYVVDSVIGKGSTGIVYKATRLLMGSEVAVKVLHSYLGAEATALDRFLREARAASKLRHPHIINIWEFGATDDGQPYFVMDYLEGMTLAELIKQKGFLHPMKVVPIMKQVCEALAEAHRQGIIHRDIKPENIVLQETDYAQGTDFVKVLDFGIADQPASGPGQKRSKMAAGSPAYMSPEQCQGFELDARTDIYSLGIVVFEMLTGMRPFSADDVMNLFYQHVSKPVPSLASARPDLKFSAPLEAVVTKALAKKPQQRYQSVKEFQKDLEDACGITEGRSRKHEPAGIDTFAVSGEERLYSEPGADSMMADAAKATSSSTSQSRISPAGAQQDYQQAVNRLLKSAKRASEPVPAAPQAEAPNDVSSWARDVLTRPSEQKSAEPPENDKPLESPGAFKKTSRSSNQPPLQIPGTGGANDEPAKNAPAARPSGSEPAARGRAPEAPDVSSWAQRVLKRSTEAARSDDTASGAGAAAGVQTTPAPLVIPGAESDNPPSHDDLSWEPTGDTPAKGNNDSGHGHDSGLRLDEPAEPNNHSQPAAPPQMEIPAPPPLPPVLSEPQPAAEPEPPLTPAREIPTPPQDKVLPVAPRLKPVDFLKSKAKLAQEAKKSAEAAAEPEAPEQSFPSEQDSASLIKPITAEPPAPPAMEPPAAVSKPFTPTTPSISESLEMILSGERTSIDMPEAPGTVIGKVPAQPESHQENPQPNPTGESSSTIGSAQPPSSYEYGIEPYKFSPETEPVKPEPPPASAAPPAPAKEEQPQPVKPEPAAAPEAAATTRAEPTDDLHSEENYRRFEEPIHKGTEALSSFANAVGALFDSAILPKKAHEKSTHSADHVPLVKSTESPVYLKPEPSEPAEAKTAPPPPPPPPKPTFDPKRFEEPINRGSLGATRFDAEVNRALRPVSEHRLPAFDPNSIESEAAQNSPEPPKPVQPKSAAEAIATSAMTAEPPASEVVPPPPVKEIEAPAAKTPEPHPVPQSPANRFEQAARSHPPSEIKPLEPPAPFEPASRFEQQPAELPSEMAAQAAPPAQPVAPPVSVPEPPAPAVAERVESQASLQADEEADSKPVDVEPIEATAPPPMAQTSPAEPIKEDEEIIDVTPPVQPKQPEPAAPEPSAAPSALRSRFEKAAAKIAADITPKPPASVPPPSEDTTATRPGVSLEKSAITAAKTEEPAEPVKDAESKEPPAKPALDPKRFDQPINKGSEQLSPLAQAVDNALDSVLAKKPPAQAPSTQAETGMIDTDRLKAKVASLKAGLANPSKLGQGTTGATTPAKPGAVPPKLPAAAPAASAEPPTPPMPVPPQPTLLEATAVPPSPLAPSSPPTAPQEAPEKDKMSDAVSRLIEAAQRVPDSSVASTTSAKPEALNRKIEAVKKKIEALKAGQTGEVRNTVPPEKTPTQSRTSASGLPPGAPRPAPLAVDAGAVSDAVNRLLEAQSGAYATVPKGANPKSTQSRISDRGLTEVKRDRTAASQSQVNFSSDAVRAAAELAAMKATRPQGETTDYYAGIKQVEKLDRVSMAEKRKQDRANMRQRSLGGGGGLVKWLLAAVAIAGIGGSIWYMQQGQQHPTLHAKSLTVDEMIANADYEGARDRLLEQRKKPGSKFTATDQKKLWDVELRLGQQEADAKDYDGAITALKQIPRRPRNEYYRKAQDLIVKYQRLKTTK